MLRRAEEPERSCCPCGEALELRSARHVLCAKHRQKVVSGVGRRFGRHRFGGRYAHWVEDFVNECYEKLLRPGGLDRYDAAVRGDDPFGAWLWRVVQNFCHNKAKALATRPDVGGHPLDWAPEPTHLATPEAVFLRECARTLVRGAMADVEAAWKAKGVMWSQRFETLLPFVLGESALYKQAEVELGVEEGNARKIKCGLGEDIRLALRRRVRDTLVFEPGLGREGIERLVDQEIEALLKEAFADEPEPELVCRLEPEDAQPEPEGEKPEPKP